MRGKNHSCQEDSLPGPVTGVFPRILGPGSHWCSLGLEQEKETFWGIVLALLNSAVLKKGGGIDISKALT